MDLIFTNNLVPGMRVVKDVLSTDGFRILLTRGSVLNSHHIDRLKNWGIQYIYANKPWAKGEKEKIIAVHMSQEEFLQGYNETMEQLVHAFQYIKKYKEAPIVEMQELIEQKILLLVDTIGVLEYLHEIRTYSDDTFTHSLHVAILAGILGKWCNYKGAALKELILAGLLHDIGKLLIPTDVLHKSGPLTTEEFAVIKRHPEEGFCLLEAASVSSIIKDCILQHHERLDGSGYPFGLRAHEIRAEAKVIAIADIYNALTSDRVYRSKMTAFTALDILAKELYIKLDPFAGLTFMKNIQGQLIGSQVTLSNGEPAKVIGFPAKDSGFSKPLVQLKNNRFLDLQVEKLAIVSDAFTLK